jgi:hypothetical protein
VAVWRAKKWLILMIVIPTEGTSVLVPMENMVKSSVDLDFRIKSGGEENILIKRIVSVIEI